MAISDFPILNQLKLIAKFDLLKHKKVGMFCDSL